MEVLGTLMLYIIITTSLLLITLKLGGLLSLRLTKSHKNSIENQLMVSWMIAVFLLSTVLTIALVNSNLLK